MVNPKKDYELLMRYLQDGEPKRRKAPIPENAYPDPFQSEPELAKANYFTQRSREKKATPQRRFRRHMDWKMSLPRFKHIFLSNRMRLVIAAVAIIVLIISLWSAIAVYKLSPDSLYKKLYVPYTAKAVSEVNSDVKNNIAGYYNSGNYVAVALLSKKQPQLSDNEKLLTGLAYLQREEYTAAIKRLEPLANKFNSPYRQQAEYYLALTYLKNEDYDRCIEKMERIAFTPSHPYHYLISKSTIRKITMLKWK